MNITAIQQALIELGWMHKGQDNGEWTAQTNAGYEQACLDENMHPSLICQPSCVEHLPEKVYSLYMTFADTDYASLETAPNPNLTPTGLTADLVTVDIKPAAKPPVVEEAKLEVAEVAKPVVETAIEVKNDTPVDSTGTEETAKPESDTSEQK